MDKQSNRADNEFKRVMELITFAHSRDAVRRAYLELDEYTHRQLKGSGDLREMGELLCNRQEWHRNQDIEALRTQGKELRDPSPMLRRLREIKKTTFRCSSEVPSIIASYQRCVRLAKEILFSVPEECHEADLYVSHLEERIQALKQEMSSSSFSD